MIITVSSLMYTKSPSHIYSVCSSIDITSQTCGHIYLNHTTLYTHPFISYFSALAWARPLPLIFRSCTHVQCVYPHIVQSVIQVLSYTHARTIASPHLILFTLSHSLFYHRSTFDTNARCGLLAKGIYTSTQGCLCC